MGWIKKAPDDGVYVCEDVSSIEYRGGLFYLTDDFGDFRIKRAMRPETFIACVTGAYAVAKEWQAEQLSNVVEFQRVYPKAG